MPGKKVWIGLGVVLVLGVGVSRLLGSRPEATELDAPIARCPSTPNCARLRVPLAADPLAVVDAVHQTLPSLSGASLVTPTPTGALAAFTVGPFSDEVAVEVEAGSRGAVLWVRSASRVGRSDWGVNARRAQRIVAAVAGWLPPEALAR